jgi:TonB family protein
LLRLPIGLLTGIEAAYLCSVLYFMLRLGFGLWKTGAMRRNAQSVDLTGELKTCWDRHCRIFQVHRATLAVTPYVSGPVVVGLWRSWLLLPPNLLERISTQDMDAALAHEFAHMRRRDFAKNIVYAVLSLPVTYHPVMWLLQARVAESREMICDGQAAESVEGKENYVRSLLRLASALSPTPQVTTLHAIGIFDANTLERRIMNLKMRRMEINGARRFAYAAACILIGFVTCTSALALRLDVQDQTPTVMANGKSYGNFTAPSPIYKKQPVYPVKAKVDKNWVNGTCVLSVSLNKEGVPTDIHVVKSLRADYDKSAVTAVRDWRFNPALRDGKPVAVDAIVKIHYSMLP